MCTGLSDQCPASVANAIAAAFQTQGYYVQSDIIYQLRLEDFGEWAPVLYVFSVLAGLIMMAMGQPPRHYLWFLIGPAIFNWTLFTTTPVTGVAWNVAGRDQDQKIVWKLAEVGLLNTNLVQRNPNGSETVNYYKDIIRDNGESRNFKFGASNQITVSKDSAPTGQVYVSLLFLQFDALISETMRALSYWTGIYSQTTNSSSSTNTPESPNSVSSEDGAWHILSSTKWPMLENVTAAAFHNQDLRESFVTFFANECGDIVARHIDEAGYVNAAYSKGSNLPNSVLDVQPRNYIPNPFGPNIPIPIDFNMLKSELTTTTIPVPRALAESLKKQSTTHHGSFNDFVKTAHTSNGDNLIINVLQHGNITCKAYFWLLVQGMRWEAGHAYNQLVREGLEHGVKEDQVVYNFLYGWNFNQDKKLTIDEQKQFIQDLILLHIFRNEIAFAQNPINERWSPSEKSVDYTVAYQRNIGSKNKYGELYTWAKMMPYVQGVLLYILTMAYPIVCLVMIIPGWWKTMLSWMAFMAWAKSWDVGFAIVITLERSIWAMIGNHVDAAAINGRIYQLQKAGTLKVQCDGGADYGCSVPDIIGSKQSYLDAAKTFDTAFLLSGNLDMDKANSYYIYLMSALYFAVPAVAGQVLLGAKAGASSLATNLISGSATRIGEAAGMAAGGDIATRGNNAMSINEQTAQVKSLRSGKGAGLMQQAFGAQNAALEMGAEREMLGTIAGRNNDAITTAERQMGINSKAVEAAATFGGVLVDAGRGFAAGRPPKPGDPGNISDPASPGSSPGASPQVAYDWSKGRTAALEAIPGAGVKHAATAGLWREYANFAGYAGHKLRENVGLQNQAAQLGMQQSGEHSMGQRYSQAAQQVAGEDAWRAKRNFANQITAKATALGVFAGQYSAGMKPMSSEGMAGVGMLGDDMQKLFNYPASGYKKQVSDGMARINTFYGSNAGMYQNHSNGLTYGIGTSMLGTAQHLSALGGNIQPYTYAFGTNGRKLDATQVGQEIKTGMDNDLVNQQQALLTVGPNQTREGNDALIRDIQGQRDVLHGGAGMAPPPPSNATNVNQPNPNPPTRDFTLAGK